MTTQLQIGDIHQNHQGIVEGSNQFVLASKTAAPMGIAESKDTMTPAPRKDCCSSAVDYVVPPEKQPSCWKNLTPCQKTAICCGSVFTVGGGTIGTLIGTGVVSSSGGGLIAVIVIGVCCSIKLAIGGIYCYKKFSDQNN